jgi:hypothetical protein
MSKFGRLGFAAIGIGVLAACGNSNDPTRPLPEEPIDQTIYDLVDGPINRPSSLNVLAGRTGVPRVVRVDNNENWDFSFGMLDGEPVWLPRGFFAGFPSSSGIVESDFDFDDVIFAPDNIDAYEFENPVQITVGKTYVLRSRPDPGLSITCVIYAKAEVLAVQGDPARLDIRVFWNPNCNETNLSS